MLKNRLKKLTLIVLGIIIVTCNSIAQDVKVHEYVPNEIIIKYKQSEQRNTQPTSINKKSLKPTLASNEKRKKIRNKIRKKILKKYKIKKQRPIISKRFKKNRYQTQSSSYNQSDDKFEDSNQTDLVIFSEDVNIPEIISELKDHDDIEWVQPNKIYKVQLTPNDYLYSSQDNLTMLNMPSAWDVTLGTSNVVVAVIDTGVKVNHPDLKENIWINTKETLNGIDDDKNGKVDDIVGWDFVHLENRELGHPDEDFQNEDNDPDDFFLHGTHVSGIIGAVMNNLIGITGIAPKCKVMALKAGYKDSKGGGSFTSIGIAAAIYYAVNNGAKIINMSFGGFGSDSIITDAVLYAIDNDVLCVAAAGNNTQKIDSSVPESVFTPATIQGVLTVSSINEHKELSDFSNFGPNVDVCAPGNEIYSTYWLAKTSSYEYQVSSGTSQATPAVVGVAALLYTLKPTLTLTEITSLLTISADDLGDTGKDDYYGMGLINPLNAMKLLDTAKPTITHSKPPTINMGDMVTLLAVVEDELVDSFIPSTNLVYRWTSLIDPQTEWSKLAMTKQNNQYSIEIKSPTENKKIQYYFEVNDLNPTHNIVHPSDAPNAYYEVNTHDIVGPIITLPFENKDYTSYKTADIKLEDNTGVSINTISIIVNNKAYDLTNSEFLSYNAPTLSVNLDAIKLADSELAPSGTESQFTVAVLAKDLYGNSTTTSISLYTTNTINVFGPKESIPILVAPNPFNPNETSAKICYQTTKDVDTDISIYSLNFQLVKQFSRSDNAGYHDDLEWDGKDMWGDYVPNGAYILLLKSEDGSGKVVKKTKIAVYRK